MTTMDLYGFVLVLIFGFASGSFFAEESLDQCPSSLTRSIFLKRHRDTCYQFNLFDLREYKDAKQGCQEQGGLLLMIKEKDTQDFIEYTLRHSFSKFDHLIWIGLHDQGHESVYTWEDGTALGDFTFWADDQGPDHTLTAWYEDCVVIEPYEKYKWHDYHCEDGWIYSNHYGYICQFPVVATTTSSTTTTTKTAKTTAAAASTTKTTTSTPTTASTTKTTPTPTTASTTTTTTPTPATASTATTATKATSTTTTTTTTAAT